MKIFGPMRDEVTEQCRGTMWLGAQSL